MKIKIYLGSRKVIEEGQTIYNFLKDVVLLISSNFIDTGKQKVN